MKNIFYIWLALILSEPLLAVDADKFCSRFITRLTGAPATGALLSECKSLAAKEPASAIRRITQEAGFYEDTVRYLFQVDSSKDDIHLTPFNDMTATSVGLVKNDQDYRRFFFDDVVYTCNKPNLPPYALNNNDHYTQCAIGPYADNLVESRQSELSPIFAARPDVPAGVFTTRGFAEAYYFKGTNRAAVRFALKNFLCEDIDTFHDTKVPDNKVRQDVDRQPGGDPKAWVNECKGCHAGMDPFAGAFAYLDWDEDATSLVYNKPPEGSTPDVLRAAISEKYLRNASTFPGGFVTVDDFWENRWNDGGNTRVNWPKNASGNGPKSFGEMFKDIGQMGRCMAKKVYKRTCLEDLDLASNKITDLAKKFESSGYKVRELFIESGAMCPGKDL